MRVIDPIRGLYSGQMGGMVFYVMDGKTYARRAADPSRRPRPQGRQREMNARFRAVQWLYRTFGNQVSREIWRVAGREAGKRGHNLFHTLNCACVDSEGRLADPAGLRFTEGSLLLPRDLAVEPLGGGRFRVTWTEERTLATASAGDLLQAGVIPHAEWMDAKRALAVSGRRGDGCGTFALDPADGAAQHVYLYFAREDGAAFSPSRYFRVELPPEGGDAPTAAEEESGEAEGRG